MNDLTEGRIRTNVKTQTQCPRCRGTGKEVLVVSCGVGRRKMDCTLCKGSGMAPSKAPVLPPDGPSKLDAAAEAARDWARYEHGLDADSTRLGV